MTLPTAKEIAARFTGSEGTRLLCEVLRRQPILEGNAQIAAAFAEVATVVAYETGETILTQGGTDTEFFFILSGLVSVIPNGRVDAVRAAGTHVGEMATVDPAARRSATVTANEPTVTARIAEPEFSRLADAHPFIWRHIAREMADRLRQRAAKVPARKANSRVFVASSSEGLNIAMSLRDELQNDPLDVCGFIRLNRDG